MDPLNEWLYRALEAQLGPVKVSNEGQPATVLYSPDWSQEGRLQAEVIEAGEYYRVNCPFCPDTRHRLWVNHRWAVPDPQTGDDNLHLAHCFNAPCLGTRDRQRALHDILLVPGLAGSVRPVRSAPEPRPVPACLPANTVPVHDLPAGHPAVAYLAGRGFDTHAVGPRWGVSYCPADPDSTPRLYDRLVIPVYRPRVLATRVSRSVTGTALAGWQARVVGPAGRDVPKYLCCAGMSKARLLYGLPAALESNGPVVVCEGPTDVWRAGPGAVALFGKTLSAGQRDLLVRHFPGRPVVVLLDRDAGPEAERIRQTLAAARWLQPGDSRVVIGRLPAGGKDPADCTRDEVRAAVEHALG